MFRGDANALLAHWEQNPAGVSSGTTEQPTEMSIPNS